MNRKIWMVSLSGLTLLILAGCVAKGSDLVHTEEQVQQNVNEQETIIVDKQQEVVNVESQIDVENSTTINDDTSQIDMTQSDVDVETTFVEVINGKMVIANPENQLVLVNKTNYLPSDYKPEQLVVPNVPFYFEEVIQKKHMRQDAAAALEELFAASEKQGLSLVAASGYRSYERQAEIYQAQVRQVGEEKANEAVAIPGQSEHQTGLAIDVTSAEMNFKLLESFEDTNEGKWLREHAHEYGFIIRYPKGKEETTGYQFEPWHIRFVGKEVAQILFSENLTLEQYIDALPVQQQEQSIQTEQ
ncbi:M15 family metallopeptidase [Bacillus solimangrovi]|uniref:M15 family metallopeptidase n=1 Tax=Bacillus solimangrovi TaxID=1305675 RepID=UPI000A7163EA|nr:M15 family metallopeptidase [Bacillus solimangrovi]